MVEKEKVRERFPDEKSLAKKLESLIGKRLQSFELDDTGNAMTLTFDDGTSMKMDIWDDNNDTPGYGTVEFES